MPKIFICYRREDSRWPAQWIYNDLVEHFGSESVVFDIDTIPLGADFREYLNKEVSRCNIFLAVIGDRWLEILNQRLDQPNDFVRIEIQAALERRIPVVPILVGEKPVPSEKDLPPELMDLSYKQAAEVRAGADLQSHRKRLVDGLDRLFSEKKVGKDLKQKKVDEEIKREVSLKTYTNNIGMEFVLIPAGSFMMGSHISPEEIAQKYEGKAEYYKDEIPQHEVTISKQFYLQSTQVTQGQWQKVCGDNPAHFIECGDDCPIESVSWNAAQKFIYKLNEMEGTDKYRLPSEAEWEYACRAGTTTDFSFGDNGDIIDEYAWVSSNSKSSTHPVRTKKNNFWGLYDMHGNVFEWCHDWIGAYPSMPVKDPTGPTNGEDRVLRGGSWDIDLEGVRCAYRARSNPIFSPNYFGFRCAKTF